MKGLLFIFVSLTFLGYTQNVQFGMMVPLDVPVKSQMPKMSTNVGFGTSLAYRPFDNYPLLFELKGSWGMYSSKTMQQTYEFSDGSQTQTDVTYKSKMSKYLLGAKQLIGNDYQLIRPFLTPQIGVARMRSSIVIWDPEDEDDCVALERKTKQRFGGFVYGAEAGAEINLNRDAHLSSGVGQKIVFALSYMGSFRDFDYVNIRHMQDEVHGMHESQDNREITATFVNVSTNTLHEHKIAELYRTPLSLWGISVGYFINF